MVKLKFIYQQLHKPAVHGPSILQPKWQPLELEGAVGRDKGSKELALPLDQDIVECLGYVQQREVLRPRQIHKDFRRQLDREGVAALIALKLTTHFVSPSFFATEQVAGPKVQ